MTTYAHVQHPVLCTCTYYIHTAIYVDAGIPSAAVGGIHRNQLCHITWVIFYNLHHVGYNTFPVNAFCSTRIDHYTKHEIREDTIKGNVVYINANYTRSHPIVVHTYLRGCMQVVTDYTTFTRLYVTMLQCIPFPTNFR